MTQQQIQQEQIQGWHIVPVDENGVPHLSHDLAHVAVKSGLTVSMPHEDIEGIDDDGQCGAGLYISRNPVHALKYAPSGTVAICRVSTPASAVVQEAEDKLVTCERTVIDMLDAEETRRVLVGWAVWCVRQALALVHKPDPRSMDALNVVERWLKGEATQEELTAAADAAARAAFFAADAARVAQNQQLEKMLLETMSLA